MAEDSANRDKADSDVTISESDVNQQEDQQSPLRALRAALVFSITLIVLVGGATLGFAAIGLPSWLSFIAAIVLVVLLTWCLVVISAGGRPGPLLIGSIRIGVQKFKRSLLPAIYSHSWSKYLFSWFDTSASILTAYLLATNIPETKQLSRAFLSSDSEWKPFALPTVLIVYAALWPKAKDILRRVFEPIIPPPRDSSRDFFESPGKLCRSLSASLFEISEKNSRRKTNQHNCTDLYKIMAENLASTFCSMQDEGDESLRVCYFKLTNNSYSLDAWAPVSSRPKTPVDFILSQPNSSLSLANEGQLVVIEDIALELHKPPRQRRYACGKDPSNDRGSLIACPVYDTNGSIKGVVTVKSIKRHLFLPEDSEYYRVIIEAAFNMTEAVVVGLRSDAQQDGASKAKTGLSSRRKAR